MSKEYFFVNKSDKALQSKYFDLVSNLTDDINLKVNDFLEKKSQRL